MDFSGHLSAFPAANILQWAANERRTGLLVVRRSRGSKRLYFADGRIVSALSDDAGESYGRHLLLYGHVDEGSMVRALQRCSQSGRRLGAVLVELGLMDEPAVRKTLRQFFQDNVCDIFLWKRGVFFFEPQAPPQEEIPPASLDTMGLVLEGTRWIDELARIRRLFVHDNIVLRHGPKYPVGDLSHFEGRVGATVDGKSTLGELHASLRGSYFRFLDTAYQLCLREVLDISTIGDVVEPVTAEFRLGDLLAERMAEKEPERERPSGRPAGPPASVPVTALQGLYPVLMTLPDSDLLDRYPRPVVDLLVKLDGTLRLAELLDPDATLAGQQLDALLVELRQGRLALLPAAVGDLEKAADQRQEPATARWWRRVLPAKR